MLNFKLLTVLTVAFSLILSLSLAGSAEAHLTPHPITHVNVKQDPNAYLTEHSGKIPSYKTHFDTTVHLTLDPNQSGRPDKGHMRIAGDMPDGSRVTLEFTFAGERTVGSTVILYPNFYMTNLLLYLENIQFEFYAGINQNDCTTIWHTVTSPLTGKTFQAPQIECSDAPWHTVPTYINGVLPVSEPDTTPPVITVGGNTRVAYGTSYTEAGATCTDDTDDSPQLTTSGTVDANSVGTYNIVYTCTDEYGNTATASRTVTVFSSAPGAPGGLTATRGNAIVELSWSPPSDNGSPITGYKVVVKRSDHNSWGVLDANLIKGTSAIVTRLGNGSTYEFKVAAMNSHGYGPYSAGVTQTPSSSIPSKEVNHAPYAPTNLRLIAGDSQVKLSWNAPVDRNTPNTDYWADHIPPITDYVIQVRTGTGAFTVYSDGSGTSTTTTVTSLTNDVIYGFRVAAVNSAGTGLWSNIVSTTPNCSGCDTPQHLPTAPTSLTSTPQDGSVRLSWGAPASNGGTEISDYVIQYRKGTDSFATFSDGTNTKTNAVVTGLTNGVSYDFRVAAVNSDGTGAWKIMSGVTPVGPPKVPTGLTATAGDGSVSLSWTAPTNNGGGSITGYTIQYRTGTAAFSSNSVSSTSTTSTITSLTNGKLYDFRVQALNSHGGGPWTTTTSATPFSSQDPPTVPSVPIGLTATIGSGYITLNWVTPASDGRAAITDYTILTRTTGTTLWTTYNDGISTGTSATMSGLNNGVSYDFRVAAVNSEGTGYWTTTISATPLPTSVPGAPTNLNVRPIFGGIGLSWTAPADDGGGPITDYFIRYRLTSSNVWLTFDNGISAHPGTTVDGLIGGASYYFSVSAANPLGTGPWSNIISGTPWSR